MEVNEIVFYIAQVKKLNIASQVKEKNVQDEDH